MEDQIVTSIKAAARISHNYLDAEISRHKAWAKGELIRVGVPADTVNAESDPLIIQAIITGALTQLLPTVDEREEQRNAFNYQCDNLRRHIWEVPNGTE